MGEADVLGQVVVRAEPEPGNHIELAVASGQKNDRQFRRLGPQFTAQVEAAFHLVAQVDVDDDQVRQRHPAGFQRRAPFAIAADAVAVFLERRRVVFANGWFVFNDGDVPGHTKSLEGSCHNLPHLIIVLPFACPQIACLPC